MRRMCCRIAFAASGLLGCWSGGNRHASPAGSGGSGGTGGGGPTQPPIGSVVTCGGAEAPLPALADLPAIAALPDPFQSLDGTRITAASQWDCRRTEIAAQAAAYELGPKPANPASVTGAFDPGGADGGTAKLTVSVSEGGKTISFDATVTWPSTDTPTPYPAMIGMGGIAIAPATLNDMGVATINFPNDAVAQDGLRAVGAFYDLYGKDHPAGSMMAWAWGVSRLVDAIERTPDARIDPARLGVTGCSRNGKGALIAGAFEERILLTIPQESGSGGSASWRVSDAQLASGTGVQTLSEITAENVWFRQSFSQFNFAANRLPFDHHMIEGLVAPRALLVIENTDQIWLGNRSTYNDSMAAHAIWQALGAPDKMGVSQVGHPDHCGWPGTQQAEVTAFVQKFLIGGGTASTTVLKTDGGYAFDQAMWAPWDVPSL
jgi:hypothetical protein